MSSLGQVQVLSIVLISGVIIALVGAAYLWGIPLISKQSAATQFSSAQTFILSLNDKVIDMANSGGGEESIDLPFGAIKVVPHDAVSPDNNSIIFEFTSDQNLALNDSVVYLGGATYSDIINEDTGTFGEASPSIISLVTSPLGTVQKVTVKIHYRTLETIGYPSKKYRISINEGTNQQIRSGGNKITLSFDRNIPSGDLTMTNIIAHAS
jgi:hypothetical protein